MLEDLSALDMRLLLLSRFSRVRLCATPEMAAHQAPPSLGFSRQERWSGLPFPSPGDLPSPGIEPGSPALQADALPPESRGKNSKCSWSPTQILTKYKLSLTFVLVLPAPLWGSSESGLFSLTLCRSQAVHPTDCSENYALLCFLQLSCWWDPV